MKKILSVSLVAMMLLGVFCIPAFAEDTQPAADATVYVTIACKGSLVVTQEAITVKDINSDGKLTIDEALYSAHQAKYDGGAALGYSSANTEYGLSMTKLWGDTSGGFGYYLNNASAWSLADTVKEGDYVSAFVYSDLTAWSDKYCFFDKNTATCEMGDAITLALSYAGYDAEWNPVVLPVEGATITIDGATTEYKTDAEGKATIVLEKTGTLIISASSDEHTLVPPVCLFSIAEKETDTVPEETATETSSKAPEKEDPTEATDRPAETGCGSVVGVGAIAVVLTSIAAVAVLKRKEEQ